MSDTGSREVANVRFGQAMARARKRAGKTQESLAAHIRCTKGHISHIEGGKRQLNEASVEEVDAYLKAGGKLVRLYEGLYQPGHVDWLSQLHELQAAAEIIREYHNSLFPGLLQEPSYAKAVIAAGAPWMSEAEVDALVKLRIDRSRNVLRDGGPMYHVVMDDVVVRRPVGPDVVMKAQINAVIDLSESGRVLVQMYGWGQLPHPGLDGPFSLLESADAPMVANVESIYRGQTTDTPAEVRGFGALFGRLQANARDPSASLAFLKEMSREYGKE
jgi:transcriptional regulator with XRE-family HTH domain